MSLQPYQERVVVEKRELDEKLVKLDSFLEGPVFFHLPVDERSRLSSQYGVMQEYSRILGERIGAFI